jgi:hypothetical protein
MKLAVLAAVALFSLTAPAFASSTGALIDGCNQCAAPTPCRRQRLPDTGDLDPASRPCPRPFFAPRLSPALTRR